MRIKKIFVRLALLLLFLSVVDKNAQAQKEANNWYFGGNAGITFNSNPPTALTDGALTAREGCASISDANGNLL